MEEPNYKLYDAICTELAQHILINLNHYDNVRFENFTNKASDKLFVKMLSFCLNMRSRALYYKGGLQGYARFKKFFPTYQVSNNWRKATEYTWIITPEARSIIYSYIFDAHPDITTSIFQEIYNEYYA